MKKISALLVGIFFCLSTFVSAQDYASFYLDYVDNCEPMDVEIVNDSYFMEYQGEVFHQFYLDTSLVSTTDTSFNLMLDAGYYVITLIALDTDLVERGRMEDYINVMAEPTDINVEPGIELCPGEQANFSIDDPYGAVYDVEWYFDGEEMIWGQYTNYGWSTPGVYDVYAIYYSSCGNDTLYTQITVGSGATPDVEIHYGPGNEFCMNDEIFFKLNAHYQSASWNFGDGGTAGNLEPVHIYSSAGSKLVTVTATNICNNSGTDSVYINVANGLEANAWFEYHFEGDNCPNTPVKFEPYGSGNFQWNFGDGGGIDTRPFPVNVFGQADTFYVSLIVTNGCNSSDTVIREIQIESHDMETLMATVEFEFDLGDKDYGSQPDTLVICPGETVKFRNNSSNDDLLFTWNFGEGNPVNAYEPAHVYNTPGDYMVTLEAKDICDRTDSGNTKYVKVDASLQPKVMLQVLPYILCPGEMAYFWDEEFIEDNNTNVYTINFGDGTPEVNTSVQTTTEPHVLATHNYATQGAWGFNFSATNLCNNTVSYEDTIYVTTNADINTAMTYYVRNSTQPEDESFSQEGIIEDWSIRMSPDDHEFVIPIYWSQWAPPMDSTFIVYFWYGGVDISGDPGQPDGQVVFISEEISIGDTISAYVPINPMKPQSVGIVAAWYCDPMQAEGDPESFGLPVTTLPDTLDNLPLTTGGFTDIGVETGGLPIYLSTWGGICNPTKLEGYYKAYDSAYWYEFRAWEEMETQYFELTKSLDEFGPFDYISEGDFNQYGDTLEFYPISGECMDMCSYTFIESDSTLEFFLLNDICSSRIMALSSVPFIRMPDEGGGNGEGLMTCPGDNVKFMAIGGTSHVWHFGDGDNQSGNVAYHSYDTAGTYDAFVIINNACGRTDTLPSMVNIANNYTPGADFELDDYDIMVYDTVKFIYYDEDTSLFSTFLFQWNFGDGKTSAKMNPTHVYTLGGKRQVTLQVSNGCGTNSNTKDIYVYQPGEQCTLDPKFVFQVMGDSVIFTDISTGGEIHSWNWSFGDGTYSNIPNPMHIFTSGYSVYNVCLTIFDSINNCTRTSCQDIYIGNANCIADFNYTKNNQTNTVYFSDLTDKATDWFWEFGDQTTDNIQNPVHTYMQPGNYEVCLSTYDEPSDCQTVRCKIIEAGYLDSLDCSVDFSFLIDSMTVSFTSTISGNITSGFWDFDDGSTSFMQHPVHTYTQPGEYTVCGYVFDSISGCQADVCKTIFIGELDCKADFSYFVDPDTREVTFTDKSTGIITEWIYEFGDNTYDSDTNVVHQYPLPGVYNACLHVNNSNTNCYAFKCKDIVISPPDDVICQIDFTHTQIEGTKKVNFAKKTSSSFNSFTWNFGDNTTGTGSSPQHIYINDGVYNVKITGINDTTGCIAEKSRLVVVSSLFDTVAALIASYNSFPVPASNKIRFKNKSSGNYTNLYWTFGDGGYIEDMDSLTHNYPRPGNYRACLNVFDENSGKTSVKCKNLAVGTLTCNINAAFFYFANPVTNKLSLTDKSTGNANKWFWNFGDAGTSTKQNPSHIYQNPGFYLVSLSVRDTLNNCVDYAAELIQVGETECKADFTYSVDPSILEVTFTDNSLGDVSEYFWYFDDGVFGMGQNPVHTYNKSGLYDVSLCISGAAGLCTDITNQPIQVGTIDCNADFSIYVDSISNTAYFTSDIVGDASEYFWIFGDGEYSDELNPTHTYAAPGFYQVALSTYNASNGCMDTKEQVLLIGSPGLDCEADFFYQVNNLDVSFFDKSFGEDLSYSWQFGDMDTSDMQNPTHSYAAGRFYNVCLTVTSADGISNTTCKVVKVTPDPLRDCKAEFIFTVDSASKTVIFKDKSFGEPNSWLWSFGDGLSETDTNPNHTYDTAGLYKVSLLIENSTNNCRSKQIKLVDVGSSILGLKTAFEYEKDSSLFKSSGYPVDFIGLSTGDAATYAWNFGDGSGIVHTTSTPTHIYSQAGTYTACLTIQDPVTQQSGTACDQITVGGTQPVGINKLTEMANNITLNSVPNPFNTYTEITYEIPMDTEIEIIVLDIAGNKIATLIKTYKLKGAHNIIWDAYDVKSGMYLIQLKTSEGVYKHKMVVKR